jgi:hypothetical protein
MDLQVIQSKIYELRGRRVMLDFDLASLYEVKTGVLNQAVKRNAKRFPADFMFQLTQEEFANLKSQFVTSSWGGTRKLPYAFTEQGVAMLSGLLSSDKAIEINISIMRAFVALRQLATTAVEIKQLALENADIRRLLEDFMEETEGKFDDVYLALSKLAADRQLAAARPHRPIGYDEIKKGYESERGETE